MRKEAFQRISKNQTQTQPMAQTLPERVDSQNIIHSTTDQHNRQRQISFGEHDSQAQQKPDEHQPISSRNILPESYNDIPQNPEVFEGHQQKTRPRRDTKRNKNPKESAAKQQNCQNRHCHRNYTERIKSRIKSQEFRFFCEICSKKYLKNEFCEFCQQIYDLNEDGHNLLGCNLCKRLKHRRCPDSSVSNNPQQKCGDYLCKKCLKGKKSSRKRKSNFQRPQQQSRVNSDLAQSIKLQKNKPTARQISKAQLLQQKANQSINYQNSHQLYVNIFNCHRQKYDNFENFLLNEFKTAKTNPVHISRNVIQKELEDFRNRIRPGVPQQHRVDTKRTTSRSRKK